MFDSSLNIRLESPAVRHAATDDRRQSRIDQHHGSFENFSSTRNLENNLLVRPWSIRGTAQYSIDHCIIDFLPSQMPNVQIDSEVAVSQNDLVLLNALSQAHASRFSEQAMHLANFGFSTPVVSVSAWLQASLDELEECPNQASEEGLEQPSKVGLLKAKKFLENLSAYVTERPDIYPMDEGSIAIDFRGSEKMSGVLFLVEKDGSGALFHRTKTSKGRLRVDDAEDLIQEGGLSELKRVGIR